MNVVQLWGPLINDGHSLPADLSSDRYTLGKISYSMLDNDGYVELMNLLIDFNVLIALAIPVIAIVIVIFILMT